MRMSRLLALTLLIAAAAGVWILSIGRAEPASKSAATDAPIRFENRAAAALVGFVLNNSTTEDKPIIDCVLGGVALFDYDRDGFLDIYFTNGAAIPSLQKTGATFQNRLYRNNHDGTFTDVTERAGVGGIGYSMGVAAADYDNDGWVDLYVTGVNRNILYHNNGNGTFTDVTQKAGVGAEMPGGKKPWSVAAAWVDYNNDGLLDLFVANYLDWSVENNRVCGEPGRRLSCSPEMYAGLPNILYRNNGDGTFTDVSAASGIAGHIGKGMSVAIADVDGDGFSDIFVNNDKMPNFLFRNQAGKTFAEQGVESGVGFSQDGLTVSNMGLDFRDVDNDGRPDVLITALDGETFPYFKNIGGGLFQDMSFQAGLGYPSSRMSGWGVGAYDFDNDGYKDLFTANSHVSENAPLYGPHQYRQPDAIFRNRRDGRFYDVSASAGAPFHSTAAHRGCAFGDLDNDGRIDVVCSAIGSRAEVLRNVSPRTGHWLIIQTEGRRSNRDGIGTRIRITGASGLVQYNHVTSAGSYASSSDTRVHFGLGSDTRIREIELRWPSSTVQVLHDVAVDRVLKIVEQ